MRKEVMPRRHDVITRRAGSGVPAYWPEVKVDRREKLIVWIARGSKRGEFAGVSEMHRVPGTELWAVKVHRIKEAPPRWQRPVMIAGIVSAVIAASCALLSYAVRTVTTAMGQAFGMLPDVSIPMFIVLAVISSILMAALRRQVVEVIVRVWR